MTLYIIHFLVILGTAVWTCPEWVKMSKADSLFQTTHNDVAPNQPIELNANKVSLRARVVPCKPDDRGLSALAAVAD